MYNFNKKKVIDALPKITVNMVLDLYNTTIENARIRVTNEYHDRAVFEIRESDEERKSKSNFNANGEFWKEFKSDQYGTGAFTLLKFLENLSFEQNDEALLKIKEYFLDDNYEIDLDKINNNRNSYTGNFDFRKGGSSASNENGGFYDPPYVPYPELLDEGLVYLSQKRGIPIELLKRSVDYEDGKIYVTKNGYGEKLIIFESKMSGEERSIYGDLKKTVNSSLKTITNFEVGADENTLIYETLIEDGEEFEVVKKGTGYFALTEGAIDALSYNALFPDRFVSSTNGCGNFEYQFMKAKGYLDSDQGISVRIAFDADEAGDVAAQKLFNALYIRTIFKHKYKDKLKEKYKDRWLEELDSWFGSRINFHIDPIPHMLFFNNPYYQQYPVYKKVVTEQELNDGSHNFKKKFVTTFEIIDDEISDPIIAFSVDDEISKLLGISKKNSLKIKKENFDKLTADIIVREKPVGEKDWNELLIKQGADYVNEYAELYKKNFRDENGNIVFPHIDDKKSVISFYRERNFKDNPELAQYFDKNVLKNVDYSNIKTNSDVSKNLNDENSTNTNKQGNINHQDQVQNKNGVKTEIDSTLLEQEWVKRYLHRFNQRKNLFVGLKKEHFEVDENQIIENKTSSSSLASQSQTIRNSDYETQKQTGTNVQQYGGNNQQKTQVSLTQKVDNGNQKPNTYYQKNVNENTGNVHSTAKKNGILKMATFKKPQTQNRGLDLSDENKGQEKVLDTVVNKSENVEKKPETQNQVQLNNQNIDYVNEQGAKNLNDSKVANSTTLSTGNVVQNNSNVGNDENGFYSEMPPVDAYQEDCDYEASRYDEQMDDDAYINQYYYEQEQNIASHKIDDRMEKNNNISNHP